MSAERSALMLSFAALSSAVSDMLDISTITVTKGSFDDPAVWPPARRDRVSGERAVWSVYAEYV
eukprot:453483-Pyramimonas_sp.AAC.1